VSRDHRKLRVFAQADELLTHVYRISAGFPFEERFGLQSQLRRAALSVACNIVEGSARRTTREYAHFLNIAAGSAAEAEYLIEVSRRLNLLADNVARRHSNDYKKLAGGLQALLHALSPEPRA